MRLGPRQAFIYWRVAPADLDASIQALHDFQRERRAANPGLVTGLFRRPPADGPATIMETYALRQSVQAGGLDDGQIVAIDAEAARRTRAWCIGSRHVEVFEALDAD